MRSEDLVERRRLLAPDGHEHPRHDRELEGHVALVPLAEVLDDVLRPLVRLREQHAVGIAGVDLGAEPFQVLVRLRQVLAVRPLGLVEVRHGVESEAVDPEIEPEAQHVQHRLLHLGVRVVQVGLMGEEAVPVVGAGDRIPRPVRHLGVEEDDPRVLVALVRLRPHVPVALRPALARLLEPRVVRGRVVDDEVGDHADPALVRRLDQAPEVLDRAVVGVDGEEVGDVVAAVPQRRRVHGQEPDAVDAEPLQVVELLRQTAQVAGAVVVGVEEPAQVHFVEDGPLEPQRVALEPLAGFRHVVFLHRRLRPGTRDGGGRREEFESVSRARKP